MKRRGQNTGKHWESGFKAAAQRVERAYVLRCTDSLTGKGKYSRPGPPDFVIALPEVTLMVECKAVRGTSIALDRVSHHQMEHLQRFMAAGLNTESYIAVLWYDITKHPASTIRAVRSRRAWMVHADIWEGFEREYHRKSIPLEVMPDIGVEFGWERGAGWVLPKQVQRPL